MSKLDTLRENRSKTHDQVEAKKAELSAVLEERDWTPEEDAELGALVGRRAKFDKLIVEAEEEERDAKAQQEERDRKLGANGNGGTPGTSDVRVGWEDTLTYSEANPENSWYRDLLAMNYQGPNSPAAAERMRKHQAELEGILRHGAAGLDKESRRAFRAVRSYAREVGRQNTAENRDISTGTASMGDFAPPIYFLPDYAPYRTYGRTLIDNMKKMPMPETGMVFNVPLITNPTEAINQTSGAQGSSENTSVATRDMSTTYQTGSVQTIIDNLLVSQQYLDRVGPGIGGDMIVHDDQQRQMNRALNIYAWNTLFASGVGSVAYTDSAFNAQKFKAQVHAAKATIRKTDGTVAYPTTFFGDADLWESIEGAYDSNGRPYVVPQGVAYNPLAVGDESGAPEGYTGFKFAGVPAFADEAMWVSWNGGASPVGTVANSHPAVIGAMDIASWWMEGPPVPRVLPQPYANTLTVLIQQYNYCAYIPIYLPAIQVISGTGTVTSFLL